MKALLKVVAIVLKALAWLLVILVPAIGVWVASSIAAYLNGPIWLAVIAGAALFPVMPLLWDLWGSHRFEKRQEKRQAAGKDPRERIVTFSDRMILRTFAINIAFIAALIASYPQIGFTALASRGDWFLDSGIASDTVAEEVRPVLFAGAEGLEWVYEWSRENPYEQWQDEEPLPTPTADEFGEAETKLENGDDSADEKPPKPQKPDPDKPDAPDQPGTDKPDDQKPDPIEVVEVVDETPTRAEGEAPTWPMKPELHPLVTEMPENVQTDYASVATYIKDREDDPFLRVKALNDYVANRVAYDVIALRNEDFPPQDAKTVFDTRKGVCAGYARLLEAMAKVTGDEVVYIVGVSRDQTGGIAGGGHAWNGAKIEGKWYLIDATWNAGFVKGDTFEKKYRTNYLFTPPKVFGMDHLPDEDSWQLRKDPITRGEFVRQPMLRSEFYVQGLELVSPKRSQFEWGLAPVKVQLKNPKARKVLANMGPIGGSDADSVRCQVRGRGSLEISCPTPGPGKYELKMFAGSSEQTWFSSVGKFEVIAR